MEIDGWLSKTEEKWLAERASEVSEHGLILEIGTWLGKSAIVMAMNSHESVKIICVDHWRFPGYEDNIFKFLQNIRVMGLEDRICPFRINSEYLYLFTNGMFDLIYIDGGHDYNTVLFDVMRAEELLCSGGTLCGHDYGFIREEGREVFPGIRAVVDHYVCNFELVDTIWWRRK